MNKGVIQKIYIRLGYWIKYERNRYLKVFGDSNYKQANFILLRENEQLYDYVPGDEICSRTSLSRIENGKLILETPVIHVLLQRLNKKYRIIEEDQNLIDSTINAFHVYIFKNNSISTKYLRNILKDTDKKIQDNFLWIEDSKVLYLFLDWIESYGIFQKDEFDEIYKKFRSYHKEIQNILIYYFAFSVYFNPELWPMYHLVSSLIKEEYHTDEILTLFDDVFKLNPNNIFKLFYQSKFNLNQSCFLATLIEPFKFMFEKKYYHINKSHVNLMYMRLVQKVVTQDYYHVNSIYESCIFNYLKQQSINSKIDIDQLLMLIKDEPYPRYVNEYVIKQLFIKAKTKSNMQKILSLILN